MLSLVVRRENDVLRFPIVDGESRIGSGHENEIVLPYPGISRTHAVLVRRGREVLVIDSDSKNGLYLGRQRVERVPLVAGISVGLGSVLVSVGEEESSDLIIAAGLKAPEPSLRDPSGSTETIEEEENLRTARILGFVRRYERIGRGLPTEGQMAFLVEAQGLLEAETLGLCAGPPASARILMLTGSPIPDGHLEYLLAQLIPAAAMREVTLVRTGRDVCLLAMLGADVSSPCVIARFRRNAPRPGSWQSDLFSYVCDKLGFGGGRDELLIPADGVAMHKGTPEELKLPAGMVVGVKRQQELTP